MRPVAGTITDPAMDKYLDAPTPGGVRPSPTPLAALERRVAELHHRIAWMEEDLDLMLSLLQQLVEERRAS